MNTRRIKQATLLATDAALITGADFMAYMFVDRYIDVSFHNLVLHWALELSIYFIVAGFLRVFSRINRFTSMKEINAMVIALFVAYWGTDIIGTFFIDLDVSERYIALSWLFAALFVPGSRYIWRVIMETRAKLHGRTVIDERVNTLIIGAGRSGNFLLERISHEPHNLNIVGLIDDDASLYHMEMQGLRVLGNTEDLPKLIRNYEVQQVTVAIPSLVGSGYQRIVDVLADCDVTINRMADLDDILSGASQASQMQDIDIADLLNREEVELDMSQVEGNLKGKTILVSGAGGSIGSEIVRQVSKFKPGRVVLLGHGENSIYKIMREMKALQNETEYFPMIGDVQDRDLMFHMMATFKPEVVYHAAAHKHVPLMEANPHEAVKNNVLGTLNIAEAAKANGVDSFVMVSTDKAVNPTNVMGSTKRMAELIVTNLNEPGKTKFTVTRFGNVLGSRGSVVPLFKRQIAAGGPITITDMRMTRFFMTIPEASRLVIQSAALAKGGQLFVLDMGEPVKIYDLARQMVKLSGHTEEEIKIVEVGMRPGEKLYEELISDGESANEKVFDKIFLGSVIKIDPQFIVEQAKCMLAKDDRQLEKEIIAFANEQNGGMTGAKAQLS